MLDHIHPRYRRRRKTTNPWKATGDEPVVITGITGIFEQDPAPRIRKLLHYWIKLRAAGVAPGRDIVDVFQVTGWLPYVWLIDVVRNPRVRFKFGLIKTHVQRAHAAEPVSRYVDELEPLNDTAMLCDYFRRVVAEGRPLFRRGRPLMAWRTFRSQQSLYLPLVDRANQIDAILAISQFKDSLGRWH